MSHLETLKNITVVAAALYVLSDLAATDMGFGLVSIYLMIHVDPLAVAIVGTYGILLGIFALLLILSSYHSLGLKMILSHV